MSIFLFRHYWSDEDHTAKIEPEWISQRDNSLSAKQRRWKRVAKRLLEPSKYAQLSMDMPEKESIDGYYIYYRYLKKDDPDPTNSRTATDITFCISTKELREGECSWEVSSRPIESIKSSSKKMIWILTVVIFSLLLISYILSKYSSKSIDIERVSVESNRSIYNNQEDICSELFGEVVAREVNYCYEWYIDQRCNLKVSDSYQIWLQNLPNDRNLLRKQCILIENINDDQDFKVYLRKKSREEKDRIRDFMRSRR